MLENTLILIKERTKAIGDGCYFTDYENSGYKVRFHEHYDKLSLFVKAEPTFPWIYEKGINVGLINILNSNEMKDHLNKLEFALSTYHQLKKLFPDVKICQH